MTDYLIPMILLLASAVSLGKKENSYSLLLEGGAEGLRLLKDILPTLVLLLTAVELFRSSGAAELLQRFLSPVFSLLGIPVECALLVLVRAIRGLLRVPHTPEQWGQLSLPGGGSLPIDHWENILGRSSSADIRLNFSTVSRQHAALLRDESGSWWVTDLGSKGGTQVNGVQVSQRTPIRVGDTLTVGGVDVLFLPLSREEGEQLSRRRQEEAPLPMWPSLLWLTLFQLLAALQLAVSAGASVSPSLFLLFPGLPTVMWTYYLALRRCGARGFEMETIAFFLSTMYPSNTFCPSSLYSTPYPNGRFRMMPPSHRFPFEFKSITPSS